MLLKIENLKCFNPHIENHLKHPLFIEELEQASKGLSPYQALLHRRQIITDIAVISVKEHRQWYSKEKKLLFDKTQPHFLNDIYWIFNGWGFEERCWFEIEFCRIYQEKEKTESLLGNNQDIYGCHFPLLQFFTTPDKFFDSVHHQNNIHATDENASDVLNFTGIYDPSEKWILSEKAFYFLEIEDIENASLVIAQKIFLTFLNYFCSNVGFCILGYQFLGWISSIFKFQKDIYEKFQASLFENLDSEIEKIKTYISTSKSFNQDKFNFFQNLTSLQLHFLCYKGLFLYAKPQTWEPLFRKLKEKGLTVTLALEALERETHYVDRDCSLLMSSINQQVIPFLEKCHLESVISKESGKSKGKERI